MSKRPTRILVRLEITDPSKFKGLNIFDEIFFRLVHGNGYRLLSVTKDHHSHQGLQGRRKVLCLKCNTLHFPRERHACASQLKGVSP